MGKHCLAILLNYIFPMNLGVWLVEARPTWCAAVVAITCGCYVDVVGRSVLAEDDSFNMSTRQAGLLQ